MFEARTEQEQNIFELAYTISKRDCSIDAFSANWVSMKKAIVGILREKKIPEFKQEIPELFGRNFIAWEKVNGKYDLILGRLTHTEEGTNFIGNNFEDLSIQLQYHLVENLCTFLGSLDNLLFAITKYQRKVKELNEDLIRD